MTGLEEWVVCVRYLSSLLSVASRPASRRFETISQYSALNPNLCYPLISDLKMRYTVSGNATRTLDQQPAGSIREHALFRARKGKRMNIKQSEKNVGRDYRLDPPPKSRTWTAVPVPIPDEFNRWRFGPLDRKQHVVRFSHSQGYFKDVPFDYIVGHEPDGRYKLKVELVINGPKIDLLPTKPANKR